MGNDLRKNGAGYRDDTAFKAISNIIREERKAKRAYGSNSKDRADDRNHNGNRHMDKSDHGRADDA